MARPFVEVEIKGKKLNAVLDTGAWRSYILKEFAKDASSFPVEPFEVLVGGKRLKFKAVHMITGIVKDTIGRKYRFSEPIFAVNDLGEENGKRIEILLGAWTLENWGADIDESTTPPQVDFVKLRKGELVEL